MPSQCSSFCSMFLNLAGKITRLVNYIFISVCIILVVSDPQILVPKLQDGMYVFASLLTAIWVTSGFVAFVHRRLSWERCNIWEPGWAAGLNAEGEPKPGGKLFFLYILQLQPVLIAIKACSTGMSQELKEEKALTALCEGAPSALLQVYALLVEGPKGNPAILCLSVVSSICTVAVGLNNSYEVFLAPGERQQQGKLQGTFLTGFRACDFFARIGVWAFLGVALRPTETKHHGVQQPYLPFLVVAELLLISVLLKVNLKLKTWWGLLEKQTFIGVMQAFLGTFWSCHGKNLLRQHRLARALLMLRTLQVVATFWLLALVYSRGECSLAAQPVVVLLALATMGAFTLTFLVVAADEIGMAWFAVNFFPLSSGWRGGKLELAARYGVVPRVEHLLREPSDFSEEDRVASFCQAAEAGHISVLHTFVKFGVSPAAMWKGHAAAHHAAAEGRMDVIEALQALGANPMEACDDDGRSCVFIAAAYGHLDVVLAQKEAGCDVDKARKDGRNALFLPAEYGYLDVVMALKEAGCDVHKTDSDGLTPLFLAAKAGHLHVVLALLEAGCDVDKTEKNGWTPVSIAARSNHLHVVKALMGAGCDVDKADKYGRTPICIAAENGHLDVVKALQEGGCDIDKADNIGRYPFLIAAENGHVDTVKALKEAGCAVNKADKYGLTPMHIAARYGRLEVMKALQVVGCGMEMALHHALLGNAAHILATVEFLLAIVDVNAGIGGARPLDIAHERHPNSPVLDALVKAGAVAGPRPQLVGLTALKPRAAPPHAFRFFTCGLPDLAQSSGKFYYEIQLLSDFRAAQVGWLTPDFQAGEFDGKGVGDDQNGWAFDGRGCKMWHNFTGCEALAMKEWEVQDVLGFAIDLDAGEIQLRRGLAEQPITMPFQAHRKQMQLAEIK